jgi:hypothetical protein
LLAKSQRATPPTSETTECNSSTCSSTLLIPLSTHPSPESKQLPNLPITTTAHDRYVQHPRLISFVRTHSRCCATYFRALRLSRCKHSDTRYRQPTFYFTYFNMVFSIIPLFIFHRNIANIIEYSLALGNPSTVFPARPVSEPLRCVFWSSR